MARVELKTKYFLDEIRRMNEDSVEDSCKLLTKNIKESIVQDPLPSMPWKEPKGKTGELKGSISYQTSNGKSGGLSSPADSSDGVKRPNSKYNEVVGAVGTNIFYGSYVEEGTSKMAPRPYLRFGLSKSWKFIMQIFKINGNKRFK